MYAKPKRQKKRMNGGVNIWDNAPVGATLAVAPNYDYPLITVTNSIIQNIYQ